MACFYPISIKNATPWRTNKSFHIVSCGQCIGCRLERSRQWAIRCVHESQMHKDNIFVTLTYDEEHLPSDGSLRPQDMTLFLKRLRKHYCKQKIRFFQCGEYGELFRRPHHHIIMFGFDFQDKTYWTTRDGYRYYISETLKKIWPFGNHLITDCTFETAAYVARYITKKQNGQAAEKHYNGLKPEYITMSRRPGIGAGWYEKFKSDVFPRDEVVIRGKKMRPPRFYDKLFDGESPEKMSRIKHLRERRAAEHYENNTPERLAVREVCQLARAKKLIRGYENG